MSANLRLFTILGALAALNSLAGAAPTVIPLAGTWDFQLDREDSGITNRWHSGALADKIRLPGALQNQGYGDDPTVETKWTGEVGTDRWRTEPQYEKYRQPGNLRIPFFLQPQKHYVGPAWYQRRLEIPASWAGQRVGLILERPHWETHVWVDGQDFGTNNSLSTPHVYDLGTRLTPGPHVLTIRVDNRVLVDVGAWSHSVSDHTQGNWNGVVGRIELFATPPVWIDDLRVFPQVSTKSVKVKGAIGNATGQAGSSRIDLRVASAIPRKTAQSSLRETTVEARWTATGGAFEAEIGLGADVRLWDEFDPALYRLTATINDHGHQVSTSFGMREMGTRDRMITVNDRKTFLRGTLECCIFPRTGYPPTDAQEWRRIIRICQEHGLNHIRFHSWCPPEAAFIAADELGFYYQIECSVWTNPGLGKSIDQWIYDESERIVRAYGNHPSFALLASGNEPHGAKREEYLANWVNHWKAKDPRRLYTSASAYPTIPENQYHVKHEPRGTKGWGGRDYRDTIKDLSAPVIVHEMGQWCVYPNFDEMAKYTGPLKPRNLEIFRETLSDHGMLDQWRDFLRASGRFQALCYKEEIEAAYRTPGVSGVQLLDLHDFPGQGTALVGILDPFWDSKGYITAAEFRRFYDATVPLVRLSKRVWASGEKLVADVEVANLGATRLQRTATLWRCIDENGKVLLAGKFPAQDMPVDRGLYIGQISIDTASLPAPGQYRLTVGLEGTRFENDWSFWVYTATPDPTEPPDLLIAHSFDDRVRARLAEGGKVLLAVSKLSSIHPKGSFTPIFWNRYMFNSQACQTLGLLCDEKHPALKLFPTAFHCDWQWEDPVKNSRAMVLDSLPQKLRPIVQVIDDWNTNRKLGLVWECRVGQGRLLVCSSDLENRLESRPAARQLRQSLLAYMSGREFNPKVTVPIESLETLFERAKPSNLVKLNARVIEVGSEDRANGNVAAKAIDGDPETFWHTRWQPANDPMPHHLVIDLGQETTIAGITYLPRQDMINGRIASAEIFCSTKADAWGNATAKASWRNTDALQQIRFGQPQKARFIKVVVQSEVNKNAFAAIAELDVLLKEE